MKFRELVQGEVSVGTYIADLERRVRRQYGRSSRSQIERLADFAQDPDRRFYMGTWETPARIILNEISVLRDRVQELESS